MEEVIVVLQNSQTAQTYEFPLPLDVEDVIEKLGGDEDDMYIVDFQVSYQRIFTGTINDINYIYNCLESLDKVIYDNLNVLIEQHFNDIEEVYEQQGNIIYYEDVNSSTELAQKYVDEGVFGDISEKVEYYIDYEKLGNDIELESTIIKADTGIFIIG